MHVLPVVRAVGRQWLQSGKWTPAWIARHMPSKVSVKVSSTSKSFMYSEEMQRHLLSDDKKLQTSSRLVEMTPSEMFDRMSNQAFSEQPEWMYFTCKCGDLSDQVLAAAEDWKRLRVEPALSDAVGSPEHPSVWIGGKGTSTTAHYDVMDNVFVQLHGRKRFRLWGANSAPELHVFPDVHPRARKSQIEEIQELVKLCPPTEEIVLEPGDTLHLPAFTFHQVEALDVSISVNLFSVCRTQMHGGRILSIPVPLLNAASMSKFKKNIDIGQVLLLLVDNILPIFGIEMASRDYIIRHLLETRHRTLAASMPPPPPPSSSSSPPPSSSSPPPSSSSLSENTIGMVNLNLDQHRIETLASWWKVMHQDMVASGHYTNPTEIDGVRDIIVSHLLESWALQLNDGKPEKVHRTIESAAKAMHTIPVPGN